MRNHKYKLGDTVEVTTMTGKVEGIIIGLLDYERFDYEIGKTNGSGGTMRASENHVEKQMVLKAYCFRSEYLGICFWSHKEDRPELVAKGHWKRFPKGDMEKVVEL